MLIMDGILQSLAYYSFDDYNIIGSYIFYECNSVFPIEIWSLHAEVIDSLRAFWNRDMGKPFRDISA